MNLVEILNQKNQKNDSVIDISQLSIDDYNYVLNEKIQGLSEEQYILMEYENTIDFITKYSQQHKDEEDQLKVIHYNILLQWVTKNKNTNECIFIGMYLVKFLLNLITLEQLNYYDERIENSILKQLLIRSDNISLFQLFVDNGLNITHVEGLNPYYYNLKNGNSNNIVIQLLEKNGITLPENYWSYIFSKMMEGEIKKEKSYLLASGDKQFIINNQTKECVWNIVIKKNDTDLITYIPEQFYKPYILENKDLVDYMIEHKNYDLPLYLWDKVLKLVDDEKSLYKLWDYGLNLIGISTDFVNKYYGIFKQVISSIDNNEEVEVIKKNLKKIEEQQESGLLNIVITNITKNLYDKKEVTKLDIDYNIYNSVDIINNYSKRRDFPPMLIENIKDYLKTLNEYHVVYGFVTTQTHKQYNEEFLLLQTYNKHKINNEILVDHFKHYIEQLSEVKKKELIEIFGKLTEKMIVPENTEVINVEKLDNDDVSEELKIELFTDESIEKYKKTNLNSQNEIVKEFVKLLPKNKELNQKKTLAKASVLLENINNLYETFPHFESVIKHVENLMILQDKGDKSFYVPPLLLGGGPGVGKTFFCSTLSKLVNTHFELLNMESMTANFILTGTSAQWGNADTGKIFKILFNEENKRMNPIILLDELEKAGGNSSYGVMNSLLPLLERYTAKKFKDECIGLEIDASYINWFATANDLDKLTAPIKSRFDIFNIPNPTPEQRKALIKGIYKTVRENNSWGQYFNEVLPNDSLEVLSNLMAPGAARDLRKSITMACSKAIREESNIILPHHIEKYDNGETMPWDIKK